MRRLIGVEVRRLVSRQLFKGLSIIAIAAFAFAGTMAYIVSDDSPEKIAQARAQYETNIDQCLQTESRTVCEENNWMEDPRFLYREFDWILMGLGMPFVMLAWLMGASFIGAEWSHRTMTTTLTWESRRGRVLAAKIGATALITFMWILALQIVLSLAMYPAAAFDGSTAGVDGAFWMDLLQVAARIAAIAAFAGVLGACIATIGRHTAAALGVGFVYLAVIEGLIRAFKPEWVNWLVGDNAILVIIGPEDAAHVGHSTLIALMILGTYAGLLFLGSVATFKRRDLA